VDVADLNQSYGAKCLRPYHLPHRVDFGLRGTSDVDGALVCSTYIPAYASV
jgi:hypothetical protein